MRTKIKMCGLSRPEDIEYANEIKPEYIGFVFWPKSRRNVSAEQAEKLRASLDSSIAAVGVFVNPDIEFAAKLLDDGVIDIAQLHGDENETFISELKARTGKPVIKAFKVRTAEDIEHAEASGADFILLDNGKGTGENFDWSLLGNAGRNFFLAGGLYDYNVAEAVKQIRPYAVDVSSGIETDGVKDKLKMKAFADAVRGCDI